MSAHQLDQSEIVSYYDSCQVDYSIVWHLDSHLSLHYGYWDAGIKRLRQALVRMNDVLAEKAEISSQDRVLDAGCGVGGAAIYLAGKFHCHVEGITLSQKQADFGRAKAAERHLQDKVNFSVADFTKMPFADESFDVVWAVESVCHANEKTDFLKEAHRVLKKGGRLITADFYRTMPNPNPEENKWLQNWGRSWAVPSFEFVDYFAEKAGECGFANVRAENITSNIYPSAKRLYHCFVPGIICDGFLRIFGKRNAYNKANVWSTYYQYEALKRGYWNYFIFSATKA